MQTIEKFSPGHKKSTGLDDVLLNSYPTTTEGKILYYIAVIFSLFQVGIASHLIEINSQLQLSTHVGFLCFLCFPLVAALKNKQTIFKVAAWALALLSVAVAVYQIVEYEALIIRSGQPTFLDVIFGFIALFVIFSATFVMIGPALPIICGIFLLYCIFGNYLPGILQHRVDQSTLNCGEWL